MNVSRTRAGEGHRESGMVMIWAMLLLVIIALVAIALVMNSRGAMSQARHTRDRALSYPQVSSAITRIGIALQTETADEYNDYVLTPAALSSLDGGSSANLATGTQIPAPYRSVGGIYLRTGSVFTPKATTLPVVAYHAPISLSASQCAAYGMSRCTNLDGWWQIYRIELPDMTAQTTVSQVVYYVRTWVAPPPSAGVTGTNTVSEAIVARVPMRPGRFADYQMISDGTITFLSGADINGPVHSNGFYTSDPTLEAESPDAVRLENNVHCSGSNASITSARKHITDVGNSGCFKQAETGQYISFMRAEEQFQKMHDDVAGSGGRVREIFGWDGPGGTSLAMTGYDTAVHVAFNGTSIRITPPNAPAYDVPVQSGGALLVNDDVVLDGGNLNRRFTIAARRPGPGGAAVYITHNINPTNTAAGQTLGIIAEGDIQIKMGGAASGGGACNVTMIRAAMVSVAGGITFPPEWATIQKQPGAPACNQTLELYGSVATHRPPLLNWTWPPTEFVGYKSRVYTWDTRLINATPPYFPLTGTWQATDVREANVDCYAGGRKTDATCG